MTVYIPIVVYHSIECLFREKRAERLEAVCAFVTVWLFRMSAAIGFVSEELSVYDQVGRIHLNGKRSDSNRSVGYAYEDLRLEGRGINLLLTFFYEIVKAFALE